MVIIPGVRYDVAMQNTKSMTTLEPGSIKALAMDLDGTILDAHSRLSERTIRAIRSCYKQGLRPIICTGRSLGAAEKYWAALDVEGPIVCFNGAEVIDMPGGKILKATLLDKEVAEYCVDLSRSMGVYYQAYFPISLEHPMQQARETLMTEGGSGENEVYRRHTGVHALVTDLKEALSVPDCKGCLKTMFISEPEQHDRIRPLLRERFGDRVYMTRSATTFFEVLDGKASKGEGLKTALEHLGLQSNEVIAFGDEENDLPMFQIAGFSAAPANAKDEVRAAADTVIRANTEDGVARFLEETFGLTGV
jgi:Cof subfamily protein (haloacid dehalogenase superfamily)